MCAKVADALDSSEALETLIPKRSRKPTSKYLNSVNSERSNGNKRCNQSVTRRSARHQKKNLADQTSSKLKLFPIFTTRSTNDKELMKIGKSNGSDVTDDMQSDLCGEPIKMEDNRKLVGRTPTKRLKVRRNNRKKNVGGEMVSGCEENKLTDLDCSITYSHANIMQSEDTENIVLPSSNTELDVCEIVNDICLKTATAVDCDIDFALTKKSLKISDSSSISKNVKFNGNNKDSGCKRQKRKKQNTQCDKSIKIVSSTDVIPEISVRRRSLRSGGSRNTLINYSEIGFDFKQDHKQTFKKSLVKSSGSSDDECVVLNSRGIECSKNLSTDICKNVTKSENVKEQVKFFPIFTSNKVSNDSKNHSLNVKRKASVEEIFEDNNDKNVNFQNINSAKRKKQTVTECPLKQISLVGQNSLFSDSPKNLDEKCNFSLVDNKSKVLENSDNKKKSQKSREVESSCISFHSKENGNKSYLSNSKAETIYLTDGECTIKTSELGNAVSNRTSDRKVHNLYSKCISFPVLSHLNAGSESLPNTVNKFIISDEISVNDIALPAWNGTLKLTDIYNIRDIVKNSLSDSGQKVKNNNICLSSDTTEKENNGIILWTDSLQNSVTVEKNNEIAVSEIKSWLLQWKNKFCRVTEQKENNSDSESFSSDSDSEDDGLSNSIIISGAPGSGKTSLIFSLANELGFTVIEVNASSSRNGRNISNQLKEALESYHVENIRIEKIDEGNVMGMKKEKSNDSSVKNQSINQNKNIKSFFGRQNQKASSAVEKKESIVSFFQSSNSEGNRTKSKRKTRNRMFDESQLEKKISKESHLTSDTAKTSSKYDKFCKISSLTIILFEDVDIVFEEDEGFWSTVKGFLKISKKPVIFTVSRNLSIVKTILNSDINVFIMKSTSKESSVKKIETCCKTYLKEETKTDLELLSSQNMYDLRRNILNAQFWTKHSKKIKDGKYFDINNTNTCLSKSVHLNTFIIGDLSFSTDDFRKLLLHDVPYYFLNAISQYQMLGYDVLYNNIFYILNILDFTKCEKVWQTLSCQKYSGSNTKSFSDDQMWEEACEIFKLKKLALQNGSPSQELTLIADSLEDFSFADTLKDATLNKFQWISGSERIKMWNAGLPICSDHVSYSYDNILQITSLIHIYILRKTLNTDYFNSNSYQSNRLILEHPFLNFDQEFAFKTEEELKCLYAVLPPSLQLNKVALTLDYLSTIKNMCHDEKRRQLNSGKRSGRFLHYFDSISFFLDKNYILST